MGLKTAYEDSEGECKDRILPSLCSTPEEYKLCKRLGRSTDYCFILTDPSHTTNSIAMPLDYTVEIFRSSANTVAGTVQAFHLIPY